MAYLKDAQRVPAKRKKFVINSHIDNSIKDKYKSQKYNGDH